MELGWLRSAGGGLQIALGVVHRASQRVQVVVQLVECLAGDHQLPFAERQLTGPLAADPVPLAAAL